MVRTIVARNTPGSLEKNVERHLIRIFRFQVDQTGTWTAGVMSVSVNYVSNMLDYFNFLSNFVQ